VTDARTARETDTCVYGVFVCLRRATAERTLAVLGEVRA
jgi:hypothetical protein